MVGQIIGPIGVLPSAGGAPAAPVLTWTSTPSDATPEWTVATADSIVTGGVLEFQTAADGTSFASPTTITHTITSGESAALAIYFGVADLAVGAYEARCRVATPAAPTTFSGWSNVVDFTIGAAKSIVLNGSSQYLSKTWGSAPTNSKIATISYWVKQTTLPSAGPALVQHYDGGNFDGSGSSLSGPDINGFSSNAIRMTEYSAGVLPDDYTTVAAAAMDDATTWHHLCFTMNSTIVSPASDRVKIYKDGVEVTYATSTYPPQDGDFQLTKNGIASAIGRCQSLADRYFNGKFAFFHLIDGQALGPSSFTTGTGVGSIHPIAYAGTYGTNGFFLDFRNSDATDQSGDGTPNNWTANGTPTYSSDVPT